jgi:hypothetical protein
VTIGRDIIGPVTDTVSVRFSCVSLFLAWVEILGGFLCLGAGLGVKRGACMYIRVSVAGSACWAFGSFHFGWNRPAVLVMSLNDMFPIKIVLPCGQI